VAGEMIQFDYSNIFQMGWFNHQPVSYIYVVAGILHPGKSTAGNPNMEGVEADFPFSNR